jgi:hypothetical protein
MGAFTKIAGPGKKSKSKIFPGGNSNNSMKSNSTSKAASAQKSVAQPVAVNNFGSYTKQYGHKGKP